MPFEAFVLYPLPFDINPDTGHLAATARHSPKLPANGQKCALRTANTIAVDILLPVSVNDPCYENLHRV